MPLDRVERASSERVRSKRQIVASRPSSGSRPMPPNCSALVWKSLGSNASPWRARAASRPCQPQPLADLVRRRLPRPAEVAVDLVGAVRRIGDRAGEQELEPELRRPPLALVEPGAGRDLQLQVHADVDHDARRPEQLGVEHAEQVAVVVEVAELAHQPFGVQRPALGVAAGAGEQALEVVERLALVRGRGDLQVVAGHALVVHGGHLAPRGEHLACPAPPTTTSPRDG